MKQYLAYVQYLISELIFVNFEKVLRETNTKADMLRKLSPGEPIERTWIEYILEKSIGKDISMVDVVREENTHSRLHST